MNIMWLYRDDHIRNEFGLEPMPRLSPQTWGLLDVGDGTPNATPSTPNVDDDVQTATRGWEGVGYSTCKSL